MNFYQDHIRRTLSQDIFKKDIFEIILFWKKYWGIKKTHKKFWLELTWFQVLWVKIPTDITKDQMSYELENLRKKYEAWNNMFFQIWFINCIEEPFYKNRESIQKEFLANYGLYPTIKENMPEATVIVDLTKSEEELYAWFSKSAKRNVRKAIKNDIYFKIADGKEIEQFYTLWSSTAKLKWFNIYAKKEYLKFLDFLRSTWTWNLYIVKKDNTIISWSVEITESNYSYYLYGATNRDFIKVGWHYFLKYEMFKYLKKKWIKKVDLLWVAPSWYENHHLSWVSQFKHSLWWEHIEYVWNFDLPLNNVWYKLLRKLIWLKLKKQK